MDFLHSAYTSSVAVSGIVALEPVPSGEGGSSPDLPMALK